MFLSILLTAPMDFHAIFLPIMEVNGCHQPYGNVKYRHNCNFLGELSL